jgi:hypothetical protein
MYPGMQKSIAQVSFLYHVNFSCLMIYYISVPYGTIQCMLLGCHYTSTDVHKLLQANHNNFVVELLFDYFHAVYIYMYFFFSDYQCNISIFYIKL